MTLVADFDTWGRELGDMPRNVVLAEIYRRIFSRDLRGSDCSMEWWYATATPAERAAVRAEVEAQKIKILQDWRERLGEQE